MDRGITQLSNGGEELGEGGGSVSGDNLTQRINLEWV